MVHFQKGIPSLAKCVQLSSQVMVLQEKRSQRDTHGELCTILVELGTEAESWC